jgi:hypothetical protein
MSESGPVLRVVRGEPSEEELAALTALVTAAAGGDEEPGPPARGRWNDPARSFPRAVLPGPGAWRSSGW